MKRVQHGITLIELMVVVLIIAVIAAVAIPSYRQYMIRANRTDAKVALASHAAGLERCFTRFRAYNSDDCATKAALDDEVRINDTYRVRFSAPPSATEFVLEAVPVNGQAGDTQCGTFTVNEANEKGLSGGYSDSVATCWNR